MITETSTTTVWTFAAGDPAINGPATPAALALTNQWQNADNFDINFTVRDDAHAAIPVATVSAYAEDQTAGNSYGALSIAVRSQLPGYPNGASTTMRFSDKQSALFVDRGGHGTAGPVSLGLPSYPFASLFVSNGVSGPSYELFVDPADGALKVKNPSGVLTTLATP